MRVRLPPRALTQDARGYLRGTSRRPCAGTSTRGASAVWLRFTPQFRPLGQGSHSLGAVNAVITAGGPSDGMLAPTPNPGLAAGTSYGRTKPATRARCHRARGLRRV